MCYVTKLITISSGIIITHLASLHKGLSIMLSTRITYFESIPFLFCIWQYSSFILLCKCLHFSGLPKWPRLEVSVWQAKLLLQDWVLRYCRYTRNGCRLGPSQTVCSANMAVCNTFSCICMQRVKFISFSTNQ